MKPEEFDDLYPQARSHLLLETFALTGDLTASRSAVRDGLVILVHHWRKANRKGDPVGWMRSAAWDRAQRHHQTHVWQRDPHLPAHVRSVLAALSVLDETQRKALIGTHLADLEGLELSRLVGVTPVRTQQALESATQDTAALLEIDPAQVPDQLRSLREMTETVEWPRESLLRHAGAARRRTHSVIGAVAAAAVVVLAGTAVSSGTHDRANLDAERVTQSPTAEPPKTALLDDARLLSVASVQPVAPRLTWQLAETTDNEGADPILGPCMRDRFADEWAGMDGSVRRFTATGAAGQRATVTQFVELSQSLRTAGKTYQRMRSWFGACNAPRYQLLSTHQITGVGADGIQFRYLDWNSPRRQVTVNVARTGRLTMTTIDELTAVKKPGAPVASAQVLADGVDSQCASDVATECALAPRLEPILPLKAGPPLGLLKEVDLPPVANAPSGWGGTKTTPARTVPAIAQCASGTFTGQGITRATTRDFVFPEMKKSTFGVTQAVAAFGKPHQAAAFVQGFTDRIGACSEAEMGSTVEQLRLDRTPQADLAVWHVSVELADDATMQSLVAVARAGDRVTQLVFVPDSEHMMTEADFIAMAVRAQQRITYYPAG